MVSIISIPIPRGDCWRLEAPAPAIKSLSVYLDNCVHGYGTGRSWPHEIAFTYINIIVQYHSTIGSTIYYFILSTIEHLSGDLISTIYGGRHSSVGQ